MGRKLPKPKAGHKINHTPSSKFPSCIGRFPECTSYTADMSIDLRQECRTCPFRK